MDFDSRIGRSSFVPFSCKSPEIDRIETGRRTNQEDVIYNILRPKILENESKNK